MNSSRLVSLLLLLFAAVHQSTGLSIQPWASNMHYGNNSKPLLLHRRGGATSPLQSTAADATEEPQKHNPIDVLYTRYLDWIDRQPLVAKSMTAAVVGSIGDVLAQWLEAKSAGGVFAMNWTRLNAFFACGLLFVGPFLHVWYDFLWSVGRYLNENVTTNKNLQALAEVFVDQTLGVVIFFPIYFYAYELSEALVSLRAPSWAFATGKLKENLGSLFWMQYKIWPLANFLNFSVVPERMRILTSNVVAVFWNAYLCTLLA